MVPGRRLELLWIAPLAPKASASTSFATPAGFLNFGPIEPKLLFLLNEAKIAHFGLG